MTIEEKDDQEDQVDKYTKNSDNACELFATDEICMTVLVIVIAPISRKTGIILILNSFPKY